MHSLPTATRHVWEWTRAALLAEVGSADRGAAPGEVSVEAAVRAVVRQQVVGLLHEQAEAIDLPETVSLELGRMRAAMRRQVMVQLVDLDRISRLLDDADMPYLVFKGPALAVQTTGDAAARGPGDLDLLVAPDQVAAVCDLLAGLGWRVASQAPRPGGWAWRRLLHTSNEIDLLGSATAIDLHWRLDPTLDGLAPFEEVWGRRVEVGLGAGVVPTLGPQDAFRHACLHAAKDEWRWVRSLVDVHRLARDEQVWHHVPHRLEIATLAVTQALVGLPETVPDEVRARIEAVGPDHLRRAIRSQQRLTKVGRFELSSSWLVRYQLLASRTPRDLQRTVGAMLLPADVLGRVDAQTAWGGVPTGLGVRMVGLSRHLRDRAGGAS